MKRPIYLDYNSTTPLDPRCLEAMLPYLRDEFGNSANEIHSMGWTARNAIQKATVQTSHLLNCKAQEIVWNSGATEGNNTVLQFMAEMDPERNPKPHFITSAIEHPSVLQVCKSLQTRNKIELTILPVDQQGFVHLAELEKAITPQTVLCSIMWVNNEVGTIQDMAGIAEICARKKIYLHTDATQAVGKVDINLQKIPIHFLTASAHKFYGPKGVGLLMTRSENPHTPTPRFMFGGPHQNGYRPGTMNTAGIVATGRACEIALAEMHNENEKYKKLLKSFVTTLKEQFPHLIINGPNPDSGQRSPMNINITFPGKPIDLYIGKLTGLAFSQGSACHSGEPSTSRTLLAIGMSEQLAQCTLRMSVGRLTREEDVTMATEILCSALASK